jgi:hypothetical protein
MTHYLQILATALAFNLNFPKYLLTSLDSAKLFGYTSDAFLSFDCFLIDTKLVDTFDNLAFLKVL